MRTVTVTPTWSKKMEATYFNKYRTTFSPRQRDEKGPRENSAGSGIPTWFWEEGRLFVILPPPVHTTKRRRGWTHERVSSLKGLKRVVLFFQLTYDVSVLSTYDVSLIRVSGITLCGLCDQVSHCVIYVIRYHVVWFMWAGITLCGLCDQVSRCVIYVIRYHIVWFMWSGITLFGLCDQVSHFVDYVI